MLFICIYILFTVSFQCHQMDLLMLVNNARQPVVTEKIKIETET